MPERPLEKPLLRTLIAVTLALALTACGASGRRAGGDTAPRPDRTPVTVNVRNLAWTSIHVYAISGAAWQSLGVLTSQGEETYEIPPGVIGARREIRLAADPVGSSRAYISDPIHVEDGDRVMWTIQDNLALSSVTVR